MCLQRFQTSRVRAGLCWTTLAVLRRFGGQMLEDDVAECKKLLRDGINDPAYQVRRSLMRLPAEVGEHATGPLKVCLPPPPPPPPLPSPLSLSCMCLQT